MNLFLYPIRQISELKPATSYVFMVRAENSHGISVPSVLSTVVKTLGAENGVVPQAELAAARAVLSGKVIISIFTHFFFWWMYSLYYCVC